MPMLRTIERPTKATLRPYSCAASRICWMRCTWLAKLATMMRFWAFAKTWRSTLEMSRSGGTKPGTSAFVESERRRSMPSSLEPRERVQVGEAAVQRELVHLEVAGVDHHARRGCGWRRPARPGWSG